MSKNNDLIKILIFAPSPYLNLIVVAVVFALSIAGCSKGDTTDQIIIKGKIINNETGKGAARVNVYTDYGIPCCGGIAQKLGSDSTFTSGTGDFELVIDYPKDTNIYRFITYVKAFPLINKFYYYFDTLVEGIGVIDFEYDQMVVPSGPVIKLPDGFVHQCNFTIHPIGLLEADLSQDVLPLNDTLHFVITRLDNRQLFYDYTVYPDSRFKMIRIPLPAEIPVEMTTIITNEGGYRKELIHTLYLRKNERMPWLVYH